MAEPGLHVVLHQQAPIPLAVEFSCEAGELVALFGPSGSGKSTVLRCIAGLHRPRQGAITVNGTTWLDSRQSRDVPAHRRSIGMVSQHYALFPHMTALENVMAGLEHLPSGARPARARKLLELVNLPDLGGRRPSQLSGGQQQRVAVARALAREPRVLLLDEPFSAVDKVTRSKLYRELADLRARLNIPVVMVTHDLDEAAALADRIVIVHHGRTLQQGIPFDIMERPADALVARLVDSRNLFLATVASHDREAGVTALDWAGRALRAALREDHATGERVMFCIPAPRVVLQRRFRPGDTERENTLAGRIIQVISLTETTRVVLRLDGEDNPWLYLNLSPHAARRNRLAAGEEVRVSLPPDAIHLMPASVDGESGYRP
ncbi:MAG: ABC transporter ATP-binding protein [Aquisalimonadaceae bacterium]